MQKNQTGQLFKSKTMPLARIINNSYFKQLTRREGYSHVMLVAKFDGSQLCHVDDEFNNTQPASQKCDNSQLCLPSIVRHGLFYLKLLAEELVDCKVQSVVA